jgi:predicted O-methyltransferase YrrM
MKKIMIQEKLNELGVHLKDIRLGDFDQIGEYTAKKSRDPSSNLYKEVGCFFRPNYERGLLMYYLVRKKEIKSVLEIGFGRGYATFCMAKAMCDHGIDGTITTVDPAFDKTFLEDLTKVFPRIWFEKIQFIQATSDEFFKEHTDEKYDFIYIDGDHRYEAVKNDWENSKDKYEKFLLFDDYLMSDKVETDIECASVIDKIKDKSKELIVMDRRIFVDDRGYSDEEIRSGQVLLTRKKEG